MPLGCLPMQSKDYTFPWQNSRLPAKAKHLQLQPVPTQRTPVWEEERSQTARQMWSGRVMQFFKDSDESYKRCIYVSWT